MYESSKSSVENTGETQQLFVEHLSRLHSLVLHAPCSQATPQRGFLEATCQMASGIATFPAPSQHYFASYPLTPAGTFFFFFNFMAVLGLRFRTRAFSSCGKRGPLFIAVRGPLTIAASLVAEHRLQTRRLSNCGSRA